MKRKNSENGTKDTTRAMLLITFVLCVVVPITMGLRTYDMDRFEASLEGQAIRQDKSRPGGYPSYANVVALIPKERQSYVARISPWTCMAGCKKAMWMTVKFPDTTFYAFAIWEKQRWIINLTVFCSEDTGMSSDDAENWVMNCDDNVVVIGDPSIETITQFRPPHR